MLPVLLFELVWKTIWLIAVALPLWQSDQLSEAHVQSVKDCVFGVAVVLIAMPWRYLFAHYVTRPGDRWRR
jgi:hypothetical protein